MAEKKRTLWAIDLNGSPLNQFSGNEFEIYEDTDGKINIAVDKKIINAESIENWNEGGGGGTDVIANPELEGNEDALTGLEVDGTKYKVDASNYSQDYEGQDNITYKDERSTSTAYNRFTTTSTIEANDNDGNGAVIETNTSTQPAWSEITTEVKLVDVEGEVYEGASITMEAHVDGETGDPSSSIDIKGNENGGGAQINIGGENDTVNINGQPYSPGTEVIANPTMSGSEPNLTGLQVGNNKYKVPQGGRTSFNLIDYMDTEQVSYDDSYLGLNAKTKDAADFLDAIGGYVFEVGSSYDTTNCQPLSITIPSSGTYMTYDEDLQEYSAKSSDFLKISIGDIASSKAIAFIGEIFGFEFRDRFLGEYETNHRYVLNGETAGTSWTDTTLFNLNEAIPMTLYETHSSSLISGERTVSNGISLLNLDRYYVTVGHPDGTFTHQEYPMTEEFMRVLGSYFTFKYYINVVEEGGS